MKKLLRGFIIIAFAYIVGIIVVINQVVTEIEYGLIIGGLLLIIFLIRHTKKQRLFHSSFKKIDQMDGVKFEEYLMLHFKKKGYRVQLTPVSGDFGADLILKRRRKKYVVQAKRYSGSVGIKAVQEIIGAKEYYGIENGMVITNSYYTKAAKELAEASGITLWDRKELAEQFNIEFGYRE
ncbi:MAG: restriction endonuclease [bacterium]|nr:restriction endonuclease [bacterium]